MIVGHHDFDDKELMDFLGQQESQDIAWGDIYTDPLVERLRDGDVIRGSKLPWGKTHELFRFRPGEVTLWAGMNGHKKSMLTSQVMLWLARDERVGISSFEMPVIDTMERMAYQAAGCTPAPEFARQWAQWNHERICYYDQLDTVPANRVLGSIYYMTRELGCKHVLVDSLTKCGIPKGEGDLEKRFLDTLSATAKALEVHIHLVAHVRKPDRKGEEYIPNKFDVRGAGEIVDQVDNLLICWADKKREKIKSKISHSIKISNTDQEYLDKNPDQRLICGKQRRGKWEGTIGLWFHDDSLQFIAENRDQPMPFNFGPMS